MPIDLFHNAEAKAQFESRRAELARLHRIARARLLWQMQALAKAERPENAFSPNDDRIWQDAKKYADHLKAVEYSLKILDGMEEADIAADIPRIEVIAIPTPQAPNMAFIFVTALKSVGFLFKAAKNVFPLVGTVAAVVYLVSLPAPENQWAIAVAISGAAGVFVLGYVVFAVAGRILERMNSPLAPSDPRHPEHFEWANRSGRYADDA